MSATGSWLALGAFGAIVFFAIIGLVLSTIGIAILGGIVGGVGGGIVGIWQLTHRLRVRAQTDGRYSLDALFSELKPSGRVLSTKVVVVMVVFLSLALAILTVPMVPQSVTVGNVRVTQVVPDSPAQNAGALSDRNNQPRKREVI